MLAHYLKVTFRNMWKHKTQSLISIFGLAFGLACFVPGLYWMRYETTYDGFYPDAEKIYRIYAVEKQSGNVNEQVPGILERMLHEQFPAMEASAGFFIEQDNYSTDGTPYIRLRTLLTDSTFFQVFPQVVISGNARQPMQVMHNIVLTEAVAIRLFGDAEKAIGQQIKSIAFFFYPPFTVTAVIKGPPPNTNIPFDVILFSAIQNAPVGMPEAAQWVYFNKQLYVKPHSYTDIDEFVEQLRDFTTQLNVNTDIELRILPIGDVRHGLNTDLPFTLNFIRLFIAAGILLMFSALFNFLNFHLDLFRQRMRELRQRAVHGATIRQLILQMMLELACAILVALLLALFLVALVHPLFSGLLNIEMEMSQLIYLFVICGIGVMLLMLFIGFIPFWRLSHLAMRSLSKRKIEGQPMLRRIAVTLQLAVSVVFIVAALVVMMQMRYASHKDLGLDRSGIIQLSGLTYTTEMKVRTTLIHELTAIPQIENITATDFEPQHNTQRMITEPEWAGKPPYEKSAFQSIATDNHFATTFGLKMLKGKWWNEGDEQKIVLNEEAVRVMGLNDPVGTIIRMYPDYVDIDEDNIPMLEYEVVGVVSDFHTLSLRNRIRPTIFRQSFEQENILYIKTASGQELEVMRRITAILPGIDAALADAHIIPLDELYDRLNHSEQAGLKMFSVMATVCLLISLFGIYAVANASTYRRRKEMAIRKITGAKVRDIVRMFFYSYISQVIVASAFALPLAYLAMNRWLQGYAYHTNIPWWLLIGVIAVIVVLVLLTVLGQVLKAANSNPADVVKNE